MTTDETGKTFSAKQLKLVYKQYPFLREQEEEFLCIMREQHGIQFCPRHHEVMGKSWKVVNRVAASMR